MKSKIIILIILLVILAVLIRLHWPACAVLIKQYRPDFTALLQKPQAPAVLFDHFSPHYGDIDQEINANGIVQPQNRVEILAPMNGRIEEIRAREGDHVKKGDTLALISSEERSAILDATRTNTNYSPGFWQNVFKPTTILAPIDGTVIVRSAEAGQNVNTVKPVLVLSNYLVIVVQVNESDLLALRTGMKANITLDAMPGEVLTGHIGIISQEAFTLNNINVYNVQILFDAPPDYLRSGMSAHVEITTKEKKNVLLVPVETVTITDQGPVVYINETSPRPVSVTIGLQNAQYYEVTGGITDKAILLVKRP